MADEVQEIKDRLDIVEFIGQHVELKQTGKNWRGLCPFHADTDPSFYVNPERQFYHCFGCQKSGDIFTFLMEREGLEFYEALKLLATKAGVELKTRPGTKKRRETRNRLIQAHDLTNQLYRHLLKGHPSGVQARQYLEKRGTNSKMIEGFELGYAPNSWEATGKALLDKGFSLDMLVQSGLIIKKDDGGWYDRFRDRLMFPVHDHMGRVVGFSARSLDPEAKSAKYINTPETPIYHKGKLLYGLYQARDAIRKRDYAVLVEGNLDVISLHQKGVLNTVAPLGTGLTTDHVNLIKRFTRRILIVFDNDEAGEKATLRTIETGLREGLEMKVATLTSGKDPDEAAQQDFKQFKKDLTNAQVVFDYLILLGKKKFDLRKTTGKRNLSKFILPFIMQVDDAIEKDDYLHRVAEVLAVSEDSVRDELRKTEDRVQTADSRGRRAENSQQRGKSKEQKSRAELVAGHLIAMLLQTPETLFEDAQLIELAEEVEPKFFPKSRREDFSAIWEALVGQLKTQSGLDHEALNEALSTKGGKKLIDLLSLNNLGTITKQEEAFLNVFQEAIQELKNLWILKQMSEVTKKIREAERDGKEEGVARLKREFSDLSSELS